MRNWLAAAVLALGCSLWAADALPCGGGFGAGLSIGADQKIFVAHKNGTETYVFAPHFCGKAAGFGLILPVPAALSQAPQLGDKTLIAELETVAAPEVRVRKLCEDHDGVGAAPGDYRGGTDAGSQGVNVVDKGQVGMFEWTLLQADSVGAFTDWLDANKYPYEAAATTTFQHYVDSKWLFVAFKVAADTVDPPSGMLLCGDLGPIMLGFPSPAPVVPSRIAAATNPLSQYVWRFFVVSGAQQRVAGGTYSKLRFSGALSAADVSSHAAIAKLASANVLAPGDWLTELDVTFQPGELVTDIALESDPTPAPYREVTWITQYEDCSSSCAASAGASRGRNAGIGLWLGLALAALCRRRMGKGVAAR